MAKSSRPAFGVHQGKDVQAVRVLVGKRPQHDRVDDAEDRRVGPDPEGESDQRHRRGAGIAREKAQPVAQVLPEPFE